MTGWLILAATMMAQQTPEFHQGVDYTIEAVLDDASHVLRARERIRYLNRSPEKIDTIWFHLHLNAFRPNSAWARRELQSGNRRFQDLGLDDHAYERVRAVHVGGRPVGVVYPHAPDSTVMAVPLLAPLLPGMSVAVTLDWTARLSTLPRRQGRNGNHYDFAQWYPRVAVYDRGGWQVQPLLPQGEFYGEFATYDVTLDLPANYIVGATGVPKSGDPGWSGANIDKTREVELRRDAYRLAPVESLGLLERTADGRKRIHWRAEQVHHFAWTTNPDYIYEGGKSGNTAVHVLFLPGDTTWAGHALQRTVRALQFMESLFGPYMYPQITNVHRVEGGGGTEFPMMIMDASADEGLIVHEIAHQWAHAILANNEFRDGWLDEGMASFVGNLYAEAAGQRINYAPSLQGVARADAAPGAQPVATPGADFSDMQRYSVMTYTKSALVFRMLHDMLGNELFRAGLKQYYERNKLQHVDEEDFKLAMEEVSGQNLDWFFQQWLHTNHTLDYAISSATTSQLPDGRWRTRVDITRTGQAWMPVRLKVGDVVTRLDSRQPAFTVTVETASRPTEALLDPDIILIDTDRQNNLKVVAN